MILAFHCRGASPPTRVNSPSSTIRRSLACISRLMSPISSRNSVPWSANSNFPRCRRSAPVNDPFSCPNNSLSISALGTPAQLTDTNGPLVPALSSWIARATTSLPVPLSPSRRTSIFRSAIRLTHRRTSSIFSLLPMIPVMPSDTLQALVLAIECLRHPTRAIAVTDDAVDKSLTLHDSACGELQRGMNYPGRRCAVTLSIGALLGCGRGLGGGARPMHEEDEWDEEQEDPRESEEVFEE